MIAEIGNDDPTGCIDRQTATRTALGGALWIDHIRPAQAIIVNRAWRGTLEERANEHSRRWRIFFDLPAPRFTDVEMRGWPPDRGREGLVQAGDLGERRATGTEARDAIGAIRDPEVPSAVRCDTVWIVDGELAE